MQTERLYLKLHAHSPNERPMNEWSPQRVHKWRERGDWSGERGVCGGHCVSCSAWKAVEEEVGWEMAFLGSYKSDSLV